MTLEAKNILKEGWLTLFKNRKTGIFSSKPAPDKELDRAWGVLHQFSSKGSIISFYQDNRRENRVMKREKVELFHVKEITQILDHPKHPHCFTLKFKGSKRVLLNTDNQQELEKWLKVVCELTKLEYKREKVIWEYYDGGLWNALPDSDSFRIEAHYSANDHSFDLGEVQQSLRYNLHNMTRTHPRTRAVHRIKRTVHIEERPEVLHAKMTDLAAIWEWGDVTKDLWHPFEKETNKQIEEMYDSGSQWAELTLCLPSPMPFLLDLHDMKLVNFRTAVRYTLRRIDNSDNLQDVPSCPEARSPSPDDFEDEVQHQNMLSPMSPIFAPIQEHLARLQVDRKNFTHVRELGEGAFGEVYLATIGPGSIPGCKPSEKPIEVAVKQLRLSDFIARHGHHSQQMEDFLREAKEMSKVQHHRVVKLMAVCTLDYPLLLIEEYMNHGDLLGVLKDSRPSMPLIRQLTYAYHVADGMDYLANELNTVHRDLAARNILVHKDDHGNVQAKVADFGLSRHLYSEMYKHQGTKPRPLPAKWMALESLMYFIFTSKSDVWSFGVLLWEIMTLGRTPYPGVENRELLEQIEEKGLKLSKPKPCPNVIFEMILDCTQHDPDERPPFRDLKETLHKYLELTEIGELECDNSVSTSPAITPRQSTFEVEDSKDTSGENAETTVLAKTSSEGNQNDKSNTDQETENDMSSTAHSSPEQNVQSPTEQTTNSSPEQNVQSPTEQTTNSSPEQNVQSPAEQTPNSSPKLNGGLLATSSLDCSDTDCLQHENKNKIEGNLANMESHKEEHAQIVRSIDEPDHDESVVRTSTSDSTLNTHTGNSQTDSSDMTNDLKANPVASSANQYSPSDEPMKEIAGPHGHLYYLLDPLDNPGKVDDQAASPEAPPLPNYRPPSLSPAHRTNSSKLSSQQSAPFTRPKAYTYSNSREHI